MSTQIQDWTGLNGAASILRSLAGKGLVHRNGNGYWELVSPYSVGDSGRISTQDGGKK